MLERDLTGRLLVASPLLLDPNFHRTVVLVCVHGDEGTLGLVLNRPLELPALEALPAWADRAARPPLVFAGGPVAPSAALVLGRLAEHAAPPAEGWTRVTDRVGLLAVEEDPAPLDPSIEVLRVFAGHAGWAVGQLEAELAGEAWWVVPSRLDDAFAPQPDRLWHDVLRRQGWDLAMFASYPPDVSFN